MFKEPLDREADVLHDLTEQKRGDVPSRVKRYGRSSSVRVSILPMRPSPPNVNKA